MQDDLELPDPRLVNRQISEERKATRKQRALARASAGLWKSAAEQAQKKRPGSPLGQIELMERLNEPQAATGRARTISEKMQSNRFHILTKGVRELRDEGIHLQNITELSRKHVLVLIRRWEREGLCYRTLEGQISHFRRFFTLLGKPEAIPRGRELYAWLDANGVTIHHSRVSSAARTSHSWSSAGVDALAVIDRIREREPLGAMLLEVMLAFGLRRQESYYLTPQTCDEGNRLLVLSGSKGGRPRAVEFSEDLKVRQWQRDVLDRAKAIARDHPQRKLSIPGYSADQMRNYITSVCRRYGLTKKGMGVTMHGLRHQYAELRFGEQAGLPTPAMAMSPGQFVPPADYVRARERIDAARRNVSENLGHWRKDITNAYLGSPAVLEKKARSVMNRWLKAFEKNPRAMQLLHLDGVVNAWVGGRAGMGMELAEGQAVLLLIAPLRPLKEGRGKVLAEQLALAINHPVEVAVWESGGVPADALELRLPLPEGRPGA